MNNTNLESFYRTSVKALIRNSEGKILLSKEENGYYDFLGGGLDHGESLQIGLKREVKEETDLEVINISNTPSYFVTFYSKAKNTWAAIVLLRCELENFNFNPSDECIALEFFTPQEIIDNPNCFESTKKVAKIMLQENQ